jgi:nucleoside-diphosphate-sugar epimerase
MKALVTGATGFIGSHLCEELARQGHNVTCLARDPSNIKWLRGADFKVIQGDCSDRHSLENAVAGFDYVFHLAGLTKATKEDDFFRVNAKGTENLIHAVADKNPGVKRFLLLSSLAAAGPSRNSTPLTEDAAPFPVSAYGRSKLDGEKAVLQYKGLIPFTILRPPAVYGPRDRDFYLFFKMLKGGVFLDWGKCYYSLLYVDDLVKGIINAAERTEADGNIYFLSDGRIYANEEIAAEISAALNTGKGIMRLRIPRRIMPFLAFISEKVNRHGIINRDKMKELKYSDWICDSRRASTDFGFKPVVSIKEGMKWTADWYKTQKWL